MNTHDAGFPEAKVRAEFPAVQNSVYLNTGSNGPLSQSATTNTISWLTNELENGRLGQACDLRCFHLLEEIRSELALLLKSHTRQIALTQNTTEGIIIALSSRRWESGDEIISSQYEHPGALNPISTFAQKYGLKFHLTSIGSTESNLSDEITHHLTPKTRAVVLSHISWTTGKVLDLVELTRLVANNRSNAQEIDIIIDGAQAIGVMPLQPDELDISFYAFPGQKWLCGPAGTGGLWMSKDIVSSRRPTLSGYLFQAEKQTATNFEVSGLSRNMPALYGWLKTLQWIQTEVGWKAAHARIQELQTYLHRQSASLPQIRCLNKQPSGSGLFHFVHAQIPPAQLTEKLAEKKIWIRHTPFPEANRVSTGFYNSKQDIDRFLEQL